MKPYNALGMRSTIHIKHLIHFQQCNIEVSNLSDKSKIFAAIRNAIDTAPKGERAAEIHLQSLKYAVELEDVSGKEFALGVGVKETYGTEFNKMRNILKRLNAAGLDTSKI